MSKDSPPVVSYMVARTTAKEDGSEGPVEVAEGGITHLFEANAAKVNVFMRPDTLRAWVERLEQKRIGEILDKRKANATPTPANG